MPKRAERVVSIDEKKHSAGLRDATFMAEACAKSDPSAESRAWVDEKFETDPAWRRYGDLTADAMDKALDKFWLGYLTKRGVTVAAEALRAELGHAEASPVERLMIDHAVMCHVRLSMIEHLYSRNSSARMDIIEHWEKRLALAQRRFTRAVTALARVRGLLARAEAAQEAARKARSGRTLAVLKQMTG